MWIKTSLIALGLAGAMAAGTPAPTLAQGVHIGPGGVGIDIGRPGYRERHYRGGSMTIMPMIGGTVVAVGP